MSIPKEKNSILPNYSTVFCDKSYKIRKIQTAFRKRKVWENAHSTDGPGTILPPLTKNGGDGIMNKILVEGVI